MNNMFRLLLCCMACLAASYVFISPAQALEEKPAETANPSDLSSPNCESDALAQLQGLDPAKSYMRIHKALKEAKRLKDMRGYLLKEDEEKENEMLAQDEAMQGQLLELVRAITPPEVKIGTIKIDGDTAFLELIPLGEPEIDKGIEEVARGLAQGLGLDKESGDDNSRDKNSGENNKKLQINKSVTKGEAILQKQDGVWKLKKENWKTTSSEAKNTETDK